MKQTVTVTKTVIQTMSIEVDVPEEELIGKTPAGVSEAFNNSAIEAAEEEYFGDPEEDVGYEADYGDATPTHINWVSKPLEDGQGGLMVVGSFSPEGTMGTFEMDPTKYVEPA